MNTIILKLLTQRIALALLSLLAVSVVVFAILLGFAILHTRIMWRNVLR